MPNVKAVESALFDWAPRELAMEWDNVGLLVGDGAAAVRKILVALDITEGVVDEARAVGADLIVAHHPVMNCQWHKVQTILTDDTQGRILTALVQNRICAICMHTNLDAADGGVNDELARALGIEAPQTLNGEKIGRFGTLKCELPLEQFLSLVVKSLGCNGLRYVDAGRSVHTVAVGGGACASEIPSAIAHGCDTFVSSDFRYNDFLDTKGINLIDAGHFPTEDVVCAAVVRYLLQRFPEVEVTKSASHKEVIQYYK